MPMNSCKTIELATATLFAGTLVLSACGGAAPDAPAAPQSGSSSPPGSLSRELDRSGGVIEPPPAVDPGMPQAAPPTRATPRTPVILSPDSPGGDPSVKPK
jgi:hypothetical protein